MGERDREHARLSISYSTCMCSYHVHVLGMYVIYAYDVPINHTLILLLYETWIMQT